MNKRLIKTLLPIVLVAAGALLYLLTLGHCFLPLPGRTHYNNEKLEFWYYPPRDLALPPSPPTPFGTLEILAWQIKHPAQARLLATAERLEAAAPKQHHGLQEVLQAMGYDCPPGCAATSGDNDPGCRITHYPSMLRRIQRDFQLKVTHKLAPPSPEPAADGSQPAGSDTNRASAAAASRAGH